MRYAKSLANSDRLSSDLLINSLSRMRAESRRAKCAAMPPSLEQRFTQRDMYEQVGAEMFGNLSQCVCFLLIEALPARQNLTRVLMYVRMHVLLRSPVWYSFAE